MLICVTGDSHGAFDRLFREVLAFESVTFRPGLLDNKTWVVQPTQPLKEGTA